MGCRYHRTLPLVARPFGKMQNWNQSEGMRRRKRSMTSTSKTIPSWPFHLGIFKYNGLYLRWYCQLYKSTFCSVNIISYIHTYILCLYLSPLFSSHHCSTPSADIFATQLVSPEADSSLVMHHARHTYPLVIERRAERALHVIDEQMGF